MWNESESVVLSWPCLQISTKMVRASSIKPYHTFTSSTRLWCHRKKYLQRPLILLREQTKKVGVFSFPRILRHFWGGSLHSIHVKKKWTTYQKINLEINLKPDRTKHRDGIDKMLSVDLSERSLCLPAVTLCWASKSTAQPTQS